MSLGAGVVVVSANQSWLLLMIPGMVLMGFGNAAVLLGRFSAAEVNPPEKRGAAISNVVLGGTVGAIFGPLAGRPDGRTLPAPRHGRIGWRLHCRPGLVRDRFRYHLHRFTA